MKVFAVVLLFVAAVCATENMLASSYGGSAPAPAPSYGGGGSSYGGSSAQQSIPAPPCPTTYLFSCQPSMQPAPCAPQSAPSGGYGSSGSYSANYPRYALPQ